MGIDPIGKTSGFGGMGASVPSSVLGPTSSHAPETLGTVDGSGSVDSREKFSLSSTSRTERPMEASPLERLKSGEINLDGYLDQRVHHATSHLVGRIDGEQLAFIRSSLRSQLEQDPGLAALVHRATGALHNAVQSD